MRFVKNEFLTPQLSGFCLILKICLFIKV
jgi:hypothetical protein